MLIERVELAFGPGFTVLTGETGAGKSIIVTALELLLGGRGDATLVRREAKRARLEAVFDANAAAEGALAAAGVDAGDELILRRDVAADGRSRCWANDQPVTVAALASLAGALVELHGQFSELPALKGRGQTDILDDFGGLGALRGAYAEAYERWQAFLAERRQLEQSRAERGVILDGLAFMINELESAKLVPGEAEELLERRARVRHAVRIAEDVEGALAALSEGEDAAAPRLAAARKFVADLADVVPSAGGAAARLEELAGAVDEMGRELAALRRGADDEPLDVEAIEARLATLERLTRKYGKDVAALVAHEGELKRKKAELEGADDRLDELARALADAEAEARARAAELSAARREAAAALAGRVGEELPALGMEGARFEVRLPAAGDGGDGKPALGPAGAEEAAFDFAANPGEPTRPLARTASGGELSRVMLAIRAASADRAGADTIVFDEVDTGVGGRVGHVVGSRLRAVGAARQVVCVTHLAQIAARADRQYFVDKVLGPDRARVDVAAVEGEARVEELARMLGGGKPPTPTTLRHAAELLDTARRETAVPPRKGARL